MMRLECAWNALLTILPPWMRSEMDRKAQNSLQEIRLRRGQPAMLQLADGARELSHVIGDEDLQYVINTACKFSPWTATTMAQGYVTAPGGHRIGFCGEAIMQNGIMKGISSTSSLNIRVARDFPGSSGNLWLRKEDVLILGPPGSGKTTLLRDIIRQRSQRDCISVVDERGEIFPPAASFSRGANIDVLTGCPKAQGTLIVLRTMSPDCIAVDEITAAEDCEALSHVGWCGVSLLATAHAASLSDLRARPVYKPLIERGLFKTAVVLQKDKSWHVERILQ